MSATADYNKKQYHGIVKQHIAEFNSTHANENDTQSEHPTYHLISTSNQAKAKELMKFIKNTRQHKVVEQATHNHE